VLTISQGNDEMNNTNKHVKVLDDVIFVFLTYKQEKYIPYTLSSAFNQTCFPSKLVIMDDASPDGTDEAIRNLISQAPKELNIEYLHNEKNIGLVAQLNKLVERYHNKLIILQAGDDESYPNRLEETHKAWIENNKPSLILANYDCIDDSGIMLKKFSHNPSNLKPYTIKRIINRRSKVNGCCVALDSDLINFFGPINTDVINEDRVNAFRAYLRKGVFYLDKPLLKYRSEVGISSFSLKTTEERFHKIKVEARRELNDIENHFVDLAKVGNSKIEKLLLRRKTNVLWLSNIPKSLSNFSFLKSLSKGVSITVILKAYKKTKKKR
jgi:glycosyltransferase involved in cell wall biosynthesis